LFYSPWNISTTICPTLRALKGASKYLERMAHAAIVRSDEAFRREDTGTKYPTEEQRSMTEGEQVYTARQLAILAAGARYFEVPLSLHP